MIGGCGEEGFIGEHKDLGTWEWKTASGILEAFGIMSLRACLGFDDVVLL